MGTKVQSKSYLPGYHSMRDLNDSNSLNWPFHCGDKTFPNAQYCNGFLPRSVLGAYPEYDKDAVKQTMLEHEAIFKNQVYELHRLYRIQRNLMDEIKRKALDRNRIIPLDTSLPSSPQNTSEDGRRLSIPVYARLSISGSCSKSKDDEAMESRPTKVRKKMFDLELPASEYADTEEGELFGNENYEGSDRLFLGDVGKSGCEGNASNGLADLNEPIRAEETNPPAYISLLGISCHGNSNGAMKNLRAEGNDNGIVRFPHVLEAGQDKVHELPTFHNDQSKIGLWREITTSGLDNSERVRDFSSFNHQDSFMASHMLGLYPVAPSSEKPNSLNQRSVVPFQSHPSLNSLSKNSQSPILGNAWYLTSSSKANPGYGRELSNQNGSSLVSKDLQAPVSSINHDYFKGINLNAALSQQERKQDDHFAGLPWLGSNKNGAIDSRDPQKEPIFFPYSMNTHFPNDAEARNVELGDGAENGRILVFPVFEKPKVSESSRPASLSLTRMSETCSTSKLLDINLPCDDAASPDLNREVFEEGMVMEKRAREEVLGLRRFIDLNSCLSEDEEDFVIPFAQNNNSLEETRAEIDLEAPHDAEEPETERELAKTAAQAIVDMSLFVDESDFDLDLDLDRLCWFSEIASSMNHVDSSLLEEQEKEVDYFESMTLQLTETKPEEFLPVSDRLLAEQATGERLPTARGGGARRGRAGRGRQQRRDFQRDILPGLASLSRHEVTEDLQALGGGTGRATGRSWQPGPARARRNSGRGRRARRDVVSISPPPIVAAIPALTRQVSIVSLTGWGKTTRRPRRQRCPPGNLKPLPLT